MRESTGVASGSDQGPPQEARRFLKVREGRAAAGMPMLPRSERTRYEEAAADLKRHYQATGSRDLGEYERRVKHLDRIFSGRRLATIGQPDVDAYVVARQGQGMKPATIRRELGTLTKMLRLAYENGKLLRLPLVHKP